MMEKVQNEEQMKNKSIIPIHSYNYFTFDAPKF